jgi:hypothetical protein
MLGHKKNYFSCFQRIQLHNGRMGMRHHVKTQMSMAEGLTGEAKEAYLMAAFQTAAFAETLFRFK